MNLFKSALSFFILAVILSSCGKTEFVPFNARFEVTVAGEAPNATITIENFTTGADSYQWTFSEGASISTSTEKNPASFIVDKAGTFTITLEAKSGTDVKIATATPIIDGNSAILTFTNIEFGLSAGDPTYGRLFSIDDGKIYLDDEINAEIVPKIDFGLGSLPPIYFFESPDYSEFNLTGASTTKVENNVTANEFTEAAFDSMVDDGALINHTFISDGESFNSTMPHLILFETEAGRKGVIKTTAINSSRILADIKVQKYY